MMDVSPWDTTLSPGKWSLWCRQECSSPGVWQHRSRFIRTSAIIQCVCIVETYVVELVQSQDHRSSVVWLSQATIRLSSGHQLIIRGLWEDACFPCMTQSHHEVKISTQTHNWVHKRRSHPGLTRSDPRWRYQASDGEQLRLIWSESKEEEDFNSPTSSIPPSWASAKQDSHTCREDAEVSSVTLPRLCSSTDSCPEEEVIEELIKEAENAYSQVHTHTHTHTHTHFENLRERKSAETTLKWVLMLWERVRARGEREGREYRLP